LREPLPTSRPLLTMHGIVTGAFLAPLLTAFTGAVGEATPQGDILEAPDFVNANTSVELYVGCQTVTPGTCHILGCQSRRGPTDCIRGRCHCRPGYCVLNGACVRPPASCPKNTGGSCMVFGCKRYRGPTACIGGRCMCEPGYCATQGTCLPQPPSSPPSHHYTGPRRTTGGQVCLRGWTGSMHGRMYHCRGYCCFTRNPVTGRRSVQSYCLANVFGRSMVEPCRPRPYFNVQALAAEPAGGHAGQPEEELRHPKEEEEEEAAEEEEEQAPADDVGEFQPPPLVACVGLAALATTLLGIAAVRRWRDRGLGAQKEPLLAA